MALKKQKVRLPIGSFKLNTASNPHLMLENTLLQCDNASFPREAVIAKKDGYDITIEGDIDNTFLTSWKNYPWYMKSGSVSSDLSYYDDTEKTLENVNIVDVEKKDFYTSRKNLYYYCDIAVTSNIVAVTYVAYNGTVYSTHIETFDTDSYISLYTSTIDSSTTMPRPGKFSTDGSTYVNWYYINDSNALQNVSVNITTGVIGSVANVTSAPAAHATRYVMDVCDSDGYAIIVYPKSDLASVNILSCYNSSPTTIAISTTKASGTIGSPEIHKVAVWGSGVNGSTDFTRAVVSWVEEDTAENDGYLFGWQTTAYNLAEVTAVGNIAATGDVDTYVHGNLTGCVSRVDNQTSTVFWTITEGEIPQVDYGYFRDNSGSADCDDYGMFVGRAKVSTKPIRNGGNDTGDYNCLLGLYTESWGYDDLPMTQRHLVFVNYEKQPVAKCLAGTYGTDDSYGALPNFQFYNSDYITCGTYFTQLENSYDITNLLALTSITVDPAPKFIPQTTERYMYIPGGLPLESDGVNVVEQGFCQYPEPFSLTETTSGDGYLAAGDYQYICVYEWMDADGSIHQSPPSLSGSVTISTGDSCTVVVPTLHFTLKDCVIAIYRTTDGPGYVFYRVAALANDKTVTTLSYVDKKVDADISSNKVLYSSAELENSQPKSYRTACIFGNRLFYVNRYNENTIYYTKEFLEGEGTGYNSYELRINVPGGAITALQPILNYLVIFSSNQIHITQGYGYDAVGQGRNYDPPSLVSDTIGCSNRNACIATANGIMFQAEDKNIYLLGSDMSVNQIGDPILYWLENSTITGCCAVDNENQVLFFTNDETYMYDYSQGRWSKWDIAGDTGCYVDGVLYFTNNNNIYESTSTYDAYGSDVPLLIDTGWINPSGFGDINRVYKMQLTGFNMVDTATRTLTVEVAYNFDVNFHNTYTYSLVGSRTRLVDGSNRTMDTSFDYNDYLDGYSYSKTTNQDEAFILDVPVSKQKCTSIRVKIYDSGTGIANIEANGYALSSIVFTVGVKPGSFIAGDHREVN